MDARNEIYFSVASAWETTIKHMARPDKIRISGSELAEMCKKMGYQMLSIIVNDVKMLETLVYHNKYQMHNDPFDRIMIAQAKAGGLKFITHDSKILFYEEICVIVV